MSNSDTQDITIDVTIYAPMDRIWQCWTEPDHIIHWNYAIAAWHCPKAAADLRPGGKFNFRMEAKDGSMGFDFAGVYDTIEHHKRVDYTIADGRKVQNIFATDGSSTKMTTIFEAETINDVEMQRNGWQSILNNFKAYVEKMS